MAAFQLGDIVAKVKADATGFKTGIRSAMAQADGFKGKMTAVMGNAGKVAAVAGVAIGVAVAAGFVKAVGAAAQFEEKMANISTLISGDSTEAVATLSDGILEMTGRLPKTPDELGAGLYDILSAGVEGSATQLQVLEDSTKLAVAGLGDVPGAVDLVTGAINAFGIDASESGRITDVLFKAVKNGKTTVDELKSSFGQLAPTAVAAGASLEETTAATAALTTANVPTSVAQTQLKALFDEMTRSSGKLSDAYKEQTGETITSAVESKGWVAVLKEMKEGADGNQVALKNMFSSSEAGSAAMNLMFGAGEAFNTTLADMETGANAVDEAFEKQRNTFAANKVILSNLINTGFIKLGAIVLPMLTAALQGLIGFLSSLGSWFGIIKSWITKVAVPVRTLLQPSMDRLKASISNELIPALSGFFAQLQRLWNYISPVVIPILKVLAVIIGGVIVANLYLMINAFRAAIGVISLVVNWWTILYQAAGRAMQFIMSLVGMAVNSVRSQFSGMISTVTAIFNSLPGSIQAALGGAGEAIIAPFRSAFDWLIGKAQAAKDALSSLNPFTRNSPSLVDWIKKGTKTIANEYDGMFNTIANGSTAARIDTVGTARNLANVSPAQLQGQAGANTGGTVNSGGNTFNLNGILADSPEAKRRLGVELVELVNDGLRAKGSEVIPT